jgi:hypothetical protein
MAASHWVCERASGRTRDLNLCHADSGFHVIKIGEIAVRAGIRSQAVNAALQVRASLIVMCGYGRTPKAAHAGVRARGAANANVGGLNGSGSVGGVNGVVRGSSSVRGIQSDGSVGAGGGLAKLVSRLEFGSRAVAMRYDPRR